MIERNRCSKIDVQILWPFAPASNPHLDNNNNNDFGISQAAHGQCGWCGYNVRRIRKKEKSFNNNNNSNDDDDPNSTISSSSSTNNNNNKLKEKCYGIHVIRWYVNRCVITTKRI